MTNFINPNLEQIKFKFCSDSTIQNVKRFLDGAGLTSQVKLEYQECECLSFGTVAKALALASSKAEALDGAEKAAANAKPEDEKAKAEAEAKKAEAEAEANRAEADAKAMIISQFEYVSRKLKNMFEAEPKEGEPAHVNWADYLEKLEGLGIGFNLLVEHTNLKKLEQLHNQLCKSLDHIDEVDRTDKPPAAKRSRFE